MQDIVQTGDIAIFLTHLGVGFTAEVWLMTATVVRCFLTGVVISGVFAATSLAQCDPEDEGCIPPLLGDYNQDGIASHADYTLVGDFWGQNTFLPNDLTFVSPIGQAHYDQYRANYGHVHGGDSFPVLPAGVATVAPFTVVASATVHGNTRWVFTLPNLTSHFAAHVNIKVRDASHPDSDRGLLSFIPGTSFQGVRGVMENSLLENSGVIREGIYIPQFAGEFTDTDIFVGLGTTLGQTIAPGQYNFLTLESQGLQGTTITLEGAFGYQNLDYTIQQSASFGSFEPGTSPSNPLIPNVPSPGDFRFADVPSGRWFDPPLVPGFEYIMESDSLFTAIPDFPPGFAGPFRVVADGVLLGMFEADQSVDFVGLMGHGVTRFTVSGISPLVDAEDPVGFPLRITFSTPFASFRMVGIPEPATLILAVVLCSSVFLNHRPRRDL